MNFRSIFQKKKSYLYLIQDGQSSRHKIGITTRPDLRIEQIREEVPKARYEIVFKIYRAYANEQRLHRKWSCSRFTFKGSGKTEWFRLNWLEKIFIYGDYYWIVAWQFLLPVFVAVFLVVIGAALVWPLF